MANEKIETKEKYDADKLKISKNAISDYYDEIEGKEITRRSFEIADEAYEKFEKVLNSYPSRINRDILANYIFGQIEKIFIREDAKPKAEPELKKATPPKADEQKKDEPPKTEEAKPAADGEQKQNAQNPQNQPNQNKPGMPGTTDGKTYPK